MALGRHAVAGVPATAGSRRDDLVVWNGGDAQFIAVIEAMLATEPRVGLERTSVDYSYRGGMCLCKYYDGEYGDGPPLPAVDIGAPVKGHYHEPHWLPVLFSWAGPIEPVHLTVIDGYYR